MDGCMGPLTPPEQQLPSEKEDKYSASSYGTVIIMDLVSASLNRKVWQLVETVEL